MSIAVNPMGLKRICIGCGGRFYDLNKRPITCPECDAEFTGEVKQKARRGRVAAVEVKEALAKEVEAKKDEGEIQEEDSEVEVVSLEDAEAPTATEESDDDTVLGEDTLDDIPDLAAASDDSDDDSDDDILLDNEA